MMPGMDLDLHVGGMMEGSKSFGATTTVKSYWIGFGFTWRCGAYSDSYSSCTTTMPVGNISNMQSSGY